MAERERRSTPPFGGVFVARSRVMDAGDVQRAIWRMAHEAAARPAPKLAGNLGSPIPRLSEPWYCCAEPTDQQLQSF